MILSVKRTTVLVVMALACLMVFGTLRACAQSYVRYDYQSTTVQAQGGNLLPVYAIPGATIRFFSCSGASASTCTTPLTTYTSASGTSCGTSTPVVLQGSSTCVGTADPYGNFGAWVAPVGAGSYGYAWAQTIGSTTYPVVQFYPPGGASGSGSGTVTSVGLTMPAALYSSPVSGSPVTGAGTLAPALKTQTANYGFMGPASGAAAAPAFRALVPLDYPVMGASGAGHAQGAVPDPGATAGTIRYLREDGTFNVPFGFTPGSYTVSCGSTVAFSGTAGTVNALNLSCNVGSSSIPTGLPGACVTFQINQVASYSLAWPANTANMFTPGPGAGLYSATACWDVTFSEWVGQAAQPPGTGPALIALPTTPQAIPNGDTATTQSSGDTSTKVANDAFVYAAVGGAGTYTDAAIFSATPGVLADSLVPLWQVAGSTKSENLGGAMAINVPGIRDTACGSNAMSNVTGTDDTGCGANAGDTIGTSIENTVYGSGADTTSNALTNAAAFGYNAKASASNTVQLGNSSVTHAYIGPNEACQSTGTGCPAATTNALTGAASGGAAPGSTFNGSAPVTFDYHTLGAVGLAPTGSQTVTQPSNSYTSFNAQQNLNLFSIIQPNTAPTVATGSAGVLTGTYTYAVDYVTATGEGVLQPTFSAAVSPSSQRVVLTNIPVSSSPLVTARNIYRNNSVNELHWMNLVTTISDNTTTTYTDNIADGSLGGPAPWLPAGFDQMTAQDVGTFFRISNQSTALGYMSGGVGGYANSSFGSETLAANTTGMRNSAFSIYALTSNTTGYQNSAFGVHSCALNTTGYQNVCVGSYSMFNNTTGTYNVAVGDSSLSGNTTGSSNTATGQGAMYNSTVGSNNSAFGNNALRNDTASNNSAFGYYALVANTSGTPNSAFGAYCLYSNTTGTNNTCDGSFQAMYANTTGSYNTGVGFYVLNSNTTGGQNTALGAYAIGVGVGGSLNTAVGFDSLYSVTGNYNTANGYDSLANITSGILNSGFGSQAGQYITGGSTANATSAYSTYLGANTEAQADGDVYETVVGANAVGHGGETVTLGDAGVTAGYLGNNKIVAPVSNADTSATGGTGTGTITCLTASCTNLAGTYSVAGGTFTTGTFLTLVWPTTTTAYDCTVVMNGGSGFLGLGHGVATATGMTVTAAVSILGLTVTFDYRCGPN